MASSTAKELVNKVLRMTGDAKPLSTAQTIDGSVGGIAERILEFINATIGDIEKRTNWFALRQDSTGVLDGVETLYDFAGTSDVRAGSAVSVWISGKGRLEELSQTQFDDVKSSNVSGNALYFRRGSSASGVLQIEIYPAGQSGDVLNVVGYKKATRLDPLDDLSVTEFDDELLVYGALMQLDLYDGMDRGYASMFRNQLDTTLMELFGNQQFRVEAQGYA